MGDSSLIDVYLIIRYEGLKSTQYFSKFTLESVNELRKDLADIGLPHPKRENIQLLSHGTIECYWQTSRKNNILLNNLRSRSNPTPENKEKWKDLSIANVSWKEASVSISDKKKRPYSQAQNESNSKDRYFSNSSGPSLKKRIETPPEGARPRFYQNRQPHDSQEDAAGGPNSKELNGTPRWPAKSSSSAHSDEYTRPFKIQKIHSGGFQLPAKPLELPPRPEPPSKYAESARDRHYMSVPQHEPAQGSFQALAQLPTGPAVEVKAEDRLVDDFLKNLPFEPNDPAVASNSVQWGSKPLPQTSANTAERSNTKNGVAHTGLASYERIPSQYVAKPLEWDSLTNLSNTERAASQNGKSSRPFATKPNPSEIIDVDEFEEIPGLNMMKTRIDHVPASANPVTLPTPPPSAPLPNHSHSDSNGFRSFKPPRSVPSGPADRAPRAADQERRGSFGSSHPPTGPAAYSARRTLPRPRSAEPDRRRSRSPPRLSLVASDTRSSRFGPPPSHSPDARRLMRESFDLKREIQALVAKHTTATKQLQSLDSSWVPEPLQLGLDAIATNGTGRASGDLARDERLIDKLKLQIEDLGRDLKKEKSGRTEDWKIVEFERDLKQAVGKQLEEERRLREEAEKALADVRRECRHPFVVPSLLDAFVQVSKLTTRGLKVSPTPAPPGPSSSFDSNPRQPASANDAYPSPAKAETKYTNPSPSRFGNGQTTGYTRPQSTYQGHTPRNGSYSDRDRAQERERGRSRDRRPYNAKDNRMESSSSRYAMPPPRVPSPPRSFSQGKNGYHSLRPLQSDAYNLSRPVIVKMEPRDDINML